MKVYIGSILLISSAIFVKKNLTNIYHFKENFFGKKAIHKKFIELGVTFEISGAFGYIFAAVFNLDRAGPNGLYHYLSAVIMFGSLITSIFMFSLYILLYKTKGSKIFAIFGLVIPLLSAILWFVTEIMLFEWFLLFSVLGFLMPFQFKKNIVKLLI